MYKVMIIDDNVTNLSIAKSALEGQYTILPVTSGEQALKLLGRIKDLPNLILLDIEMPELNGFEVISKLKKDDKTKDIPVIFLTAHDESSSELEGLSLGAVDYIKKPFSIPLLQKRLELHLQIIEQNKALEEYNSNLEAMVDKKTKTILELQYAIISTVADLIGKRDGYTGEHVNRTQKYVDILTREVINKGYGGNLTEQDVNIISLTSKLHDIGKIAIPDKVLQKDKKLEDDEFENMKMHTAIGAEAIENAMRLTEENDFLKYAVQMAKSHHEKWDGSGYPGGKRGNEIPLVARILAVADVYDALTSKRQYKEPIPHETAVEIILKGRGTHFDPMVVDIFEQVQGKLKNVLADLRNDANSHA